MWKYVGFELELVFKKIVKLAPIHFEWQISTHLKVKTEQRPLRIILKHQRNETQRFFLQTFLLPTTLSSLAFATYFTLTCLCILVESNVTSLELATPRLLLVNYVVLFKLRSRAGFKISYETETFTVIRKIINF